MPSPRFRFGVTRDQRRSILRRPRKRLHPVPAYFRVCCKRSGRWRGEPPVAGYGREDLGVGGVRGHRRSPLDGWRGRCRLRPSAQLAVENHLRASVHSAHLWPAGSSWAVGRQSRGSFVAGPLRPLQMLCESMVGRIGGGLSALDIPPNPCHFVLAGGNRLRYRTKLPGKASGGASRPASRKMRGLSDRDLWPFRGGGSALSRGFPRTGPRKPLLLAQAPCAMLAPF